MVPVINLGFAQEMHNADVEIVRQVTVPVPPCNPDVPEFTHTPYTCGVNFTENLPDSK